MSILLSVLFCFVIQNKKYGKIDVAAIFNENSRMFGKELVIRFNVVVFHKRLVVCVCVCASFPFGYEGGMWDVIVLVPDHCLSVYFPSKTKAFQKEFFQ